MSNVNAKAIAQAALHAGIIPKAVEESIMGANARSDANYILFIHLYQQVNLNGLREFCRITKAATGYSKMIDFGKELQRKLDKVTANDVMYLCIQDHGQL